VIGTCVRPGSVHDGAMEKFDVVDLNQGQNEYRATSDFCCKISGTVARLARPVFFLFVQRPRLIPSASARSSPVSLRRCSIIVEIP
jgi:hypothetical protein